MHTHSQFSLLKKKKFLIWRKILFMKVRRKQLASAQLLSASMDIFLLPRWIIYYYFWIIYFIIISRNLIYGLSKTESLI